MLINYSGVSLHFAHWGKLDVIKVVLILRPRITIRCGVSQSWREESPVMEGRREEGCWLLSPWGSPEETSCRGFLGNVDFVDKIYGGNVGEYPASKLTLLSLPNSLWYHRSWSLFYRFCTVASLYQLQSEPAELDKTYFYYLLLILTESFYGYKSFANWYQILFSEI